LVRQPAPEIAICGGGGGDPWARYKAESNGTVRTSTSNRRKFARWATEVVAREAAEYISSLLEELRLVAVQSDLPFLAYLLSVALEEAKTEKAKHSQPEPTAR